MVEATAGVNEKRKNELVEAGPKVRKMRDRIEKNHEKQNSQITPEALAEALKKIYERIALEVASGNREVIPDKPLAVFAENENAAKRSNRVNNVARMLQNIPTAALDDCGRPFIKVPDSETSV